MRRIVKRAGVPVWPRVFHNLRASRQTELESEFPSHVVCSWLGNSPLIASRHYLQVRETDFAKAVKPKALQNPVQQMHESPGNVSQAENGEKTEVRDLPEFTVSLYEATTYKTGVDGNRTHQASFQRLRRV